MPNNIDVFICLLEIISMKIKLILFALLISVGVGMILVFSPKNATTVCLYICPEYPQPQKIENGCLGYKYIVNTTHGLDTYCIGLLTRDRICYSSPSKNLQNLTEVPCLA